MKTLMAAIDFSKCAQAVLEQATQLAQALGAKLWVLHVASDESEAMVYDATHYTDFTPDFVSMPGDVQIARELSAEELKREHHELLGISSDLRTKGVDAQAILLKGSAGRLIVDKAVDLGVEIIILGSHGHGLLHKALLGSVSESVMRHAACNVMIVPSPGKQSA